MFFGHGSGLRPILDGPARRGLRPAWLRHNDLPVGSAEELHGRLRRAVEHVCVNDQSTDLIRGSTCTTAIVLNAGEEAQAGKVEAFSGVGVGECATRKHAPGPCAVACHRQAIDVPP